MIAEIQVAPRPGGTAANCYEHVEAAIALIQESGLVYELGAMGTTVEGATDEVWALLRAVHEATLHAGADAVTSHIKVGQGRDDAGPTIGGLVSKFR